MSTEPNDEQKSEAPLVAWLALSTGAAGLSVAVAFVLTAVGWFVVPDVEDDPMNALPADFRNEGRFVWVVMLSAGVGWVVGFCYDVATGQGWWAPEARKARATNPDWMGERAARRRRLRVILVGLAVLFLAVVSAFALAR